MPLSSKSHPPSKYHIPLLFFFFIHSSFAYSTTRHTFFANNPNIQELTHENVLKTINRPNTCTFLLLGAQWDGHFKNFLKGGYWQEMSERIKGENTGNVPLIDVVFLEYSGAAEGPLSIPEEILNGQPTIGSYAWFMFRDGKRLRDEHGTTDRTAETRTCLMYENSTPRFDLECIRSLCNSGKSTEQKSEGRGMDEL